jgi:hypothetical protein
VNEEAWREMAKQVAHEIKNFDTDAINGSKFSKTI